MPSRSVSAETAVAEVKAPYDPFHPVNRQVFDLNIALDRAALAPAAHAYMRVVPVPVRRRVGSVLDNLREPRIAVNDLAQGHVRRAGVAASRFVLNSTVGLLGLFDVASRIGLAPHNADFGQTLGRYGLEPGPYLVVPVFGPHTIREAVGRTVDALIDPVNALLIGGWTTPGGGARFVAQGLDDRAELDPAIRALDDATDPYATMRAAYIQQRAALVRESTGKTEDLPDFDTEPSIDDSKDRPDTSAPAPAAGADAEPTLSTAAVDRGPAALAIPAGSTGGGPASLSKGP
jgi:phospholipid-binding lipoprotein MlaA